MINVKGAKGEPPGERISDIAEPTPPEKPPTSGPNVNAVMKIMMSPKLKYPWVAGIGTWKINVDRKTRAVVTAIRAIVITGVLRPGPVFCSGFSPAGFSVATYCSEDCATRG